MSVLQRAVSGQEALQAFEGEGLKCFSMFSGIGGFDLALQRLGHEIVGACEIDRYACEIYGRHFPEVKIYHDATNVSPESLPSFDLLCGGFPCQTFSIAGKKLGFDDPRGNLFFEIARIAKEKRPRYLFLENVRGLLFHDKGETFREMLRILDEVGYDAEWQVLNSKYFVPQNRERVFIVGHLRGERTRQVFPLGDCGEVDSGTRQEAQGEGKRISGTIDSNYHKGGSSTMIVQPVLTPDRLEKRQNGRRFKDNGEPAFTLTAQDKHGVMITEPEIKYYNQSESQYKRIYNIDGISPALGVGHAMQSPNIKDYYERKPDKLGRMMPVHRKQKLSGLQNNTSIRRLTPLECERLQGFPDGWTEGISDTQRYKCLGNAVTVPVVEYIGGHLI